MTSKFSVARGVLVTLAAASVALVIAALIMVSLKPAAPVHDADTPEGAVQHYLLAYQAGNLPAMQGYVEDGATKQPCAPEELGGTTLNIELVSSSVNAVANTASVRATFHDNSTGYLPWPDAYSYEDVFELRQDGGRWLIVSMPWGVGLCTSEEMGYE